MQFLPLFIATVQLAAKNKMVKHALRELNNSISCFFVLYTYWRSLATRYNLQFFKINSIYTDLQITMRLTYDEIYAVVQNNSATCLVVNRRRHNISRSRWLLSAFFSLLKGSRTSLCWTISVFRCDPRSHVPSFAVRHLVIHSSCSRVVLSRGSVTLSTRQRLCRASATWFFQALSFRSPIGIFRDRSRSIDHPSYVFCLWAIRLRRKRCCVESVFL